MLKKVRLRQILSLLVIVSLVFSTAQLCRITADAEQGGGYFSSLLALENNFDAYAVKGNQSLNKTTSFSAIDASQAWRISSGGILERFGTDDYTGVTSYKPAGYASSALYLDGRYSDFTVAFDYNFTNSTANQLTVGFGADEKGHSYIQSGYLLKVSADGKSEIYSHSASAEAGYSVSSLSIQKLDGYYNSIRNPQTSISAAWHHVEISVTGTTLSLKLDSYTEVIKEITGYDDGYIYIMTGDQNMKFKGLAVSGNKYFSTPENFAGEFSAYAVDKNTVIGKAQALLPVGMNDLWTFGSGIAERTGTNNYAGQKTYGTEGKAAAALYSSDCYSDFTVECSYSFKYSTANRFMLGFGASAKGDTYYQNGFALKVDATGAIQLYSYNSTASKGYSVTPINSARIDSYYNSIRTNASNIANVWHSIRISVNSGVLTVTLDNDYKYSVTIKGYEAGYLYLMTDDQGMRYRDFDLYGERLIDSYDKFNKTFSSYAVRNNEAIGSGKTLSATDTANAWAVATDTSIIRHGTGDYRGHTSYKDFTNGCAALYTNEKFTELNIEFDYRFSYSTANQITIGFGADSKGDTYYQSGALLRVAADGRIQLYVYDPASATGYTAYRINDDELTTYKGTIRSAANIAETLHHIKLAVRKGSITVTVDGNAPFILNRAVDTDGYAYLMSSDQGFKYTNVRIVSTELSATVEKVEKVQVAKGTAIADVGLPATIDVTLGSGQVYPCTVVWSSDSYISDEGGFYNFEGVVNIDSAGLYTEDPLTVSAVVEVVDYNQENTKKYYFSSIDDVRDSFYSYYNKKDESLANNPVLSETDPANTWLLNDGVLTRSGSGEYEAGGLDTNGIAELYFKQKLTNFQIEFDYRHGTGGWKWAGIGIGMSSPGDTKYSNGILCVTEVEGKIKLRGKYGTQAYRDAFSAASIIDGYAEKYKQIKDKTSDDWFHCKIVVVNKVATVYIDNYEGWTTRLPDTYSGGYVSLYCNSTNAKYKNISVTDYDAADVTIVSAAANVPEQVLDYTTGSDTLNFPGTVTATDTNGFTYNLNASWECENYQSGVLGTYTFHAVLEMPTSRFKNPDNATAYATVVVKKLDYDSRKSKKYYFNTESDMNSFTCYYINDALSQNKMQKVDWKDYWQVSSGKLSRRYDNFSSLYTNPHCYNMAISRLTYNEPLTGDYEISVDYLQDTNTAMWACLCFGTADPEKFVIKADSKGVAMQNEGGGTAFYIEREGYSNYWGNLVEPNPYTQLVRLRITKDTVVFPNYNAKEKHTLRIVVRDKIARAYLDDYENSVAVRVPDYQTGASYVSIMTTANAASFDNFVITPLSPARSEITETEHQKSGITINTADSDLDAVTPVQPDEAAGKSYNVILTVSAVVTAICLIAAVTLTVIYIGKKQLRIQPRRLTAKKRD